MRKGLKFFSLAGLVSSFDYQPDLNYQPPTYDFTCGNAPLNPLEIQNANSFRIIGGQDAGFGYFPWQVGLHGYNPENYLWTIPFCGGSLIHPSWVVTAAHCISSEDQDLWVVLGDLRYKEDDGSEVIRKATRIINHPNYTSSPIQNDITVIEMDPVTFTDVIQPICLDRAYDVFADENTMASPQGSTNLYASGWGVFDTSQSSTQAETLQYVALTPINHDACNAYYSAYGHNNVVDDSQVCAGFVDGGKDSCQGDSGGPLVYKDNNGSWRLYGVVSWGINCALAETPGVYAHVSYFQRWIDEHINPDGWGETTTAPQTEPATEPAQTEPATEPAQTEPATQPAQTGPATEPIQTVPATEPVQTEPATEPAQTEPVQTIAATEPTFTEPATEPAQTQPVTQQPEPTSAYQTEEYTSAEITYPINNNNLQLLYPITQLINDKNQIKLAGFNYGDYYYNFCVDINAVTLKRTNLVNLKECVEPGFGNPKEKFQQWGYDAVNFRIFSLENPDFCWVGINKKRSRNTQIKLMDCSAAALSNSRYQFIYKYGRLIHKKTQKSVVFDMSLLPFKKPKVILARKSFANLGSIYNDVDRVNQMNNGNEVWYQHQLIDDSGFIRLRRFSEWVVPIGYITENVTFTSETTLFLSYWRDISRRMTRHDEACVERRIMLH